MKYRTSPNAFVPTFQTWTPSFTAGIAALNNATVEARRTEFGRLHICNAKITMGTTTAFNANPFLMSLPATSALTANVAIGTFFIQDGSGGLGTRRGGTVVTATADSVYFLADDVANNVVTNTAPWTWANTDILSFSIQFEAA